MNVVMKPDHVGDVRSDDEAEDEDEIEKVEPGKEKEANGAAEKRGMNGSARTGQSRLEVPNGHALKGTGSDEPSFSEVVEGKKER